MAADQPHRTSRSARILSLGFPLPGVRVDNYNICSAPAFFDYDALVVDQRAISQFVEAVLNGEQQPQTFGGHRVLRHPEHPSDVALADLLEQRAAETAAFLARGGLVVLFAYPPIDHMLAEGVTWRDNSWLGAHAPGITPSDGTQTRVEDYQHPLASFVHAQSANIAYHAHIRDDELPKTVRVFARSYGGAAIGIDYAADNGRVALLPALRSIPAGDGRYALSDALQAGIRRMLVVAGEGRAPQWIAKHPLPGLDDRAAALKRAKEARDDADKALSAADTAYEELARYQRLLWQEGRLGLEDAVLDALRLIGFDVFANDPDNLELRASGTSILLEIEASSGEIDLAPHYRLRQRIERAIEKRAVTPRGLIVINGHRHTAPAERPRQASTALCTAAEQMQYAIASTALLYEAVVARFNDIEETVATLRQRLVTETGLLT